MRRSRGSTSPATTEAARRKAARSAFGDHEASRQLHEKKPVEMGHKARLPPVWPPPLTRHAQSVATQALDEHLATLGEAGARGLVVGFALLLVLSASGVATVLDVVRATVVVLGAHTVYQRPAERAVDVFFTICWLPRVRTGGEGRGGGGGGEWGDRGGKRTDF